MHSVTDRRTTLSCHYSRSYCVQYNRLNMKECSKMKWHHVERTAQRENPSACLPTLRNQLNSSTQWTVAVGMIYDAWIENDVGGRTTTTMSSTAKIGLRLIAIGVAFACPRYGKPSRLSSLFDVHRRETISLATPFLPSLLDRLAVIDRKSMSHDPETCRRKLVPVPISDAVARVPRGCIYVVCFRSRNC